MSARKFKVKSKTTTCDFCTLRELAICARGINTSGQRVCGPVIKRLVNIRPTDQPFFGAGDDLAGLGRALHPASSSSSMQVALFTWHKAILGMIASIASIDVGTGVK